VKGKMKLHIGLMVLVIALLASSCQSIKGEAREPSPVSPAATGYPAGYTYIDYSDGDSTVPEQGAFRLDKIIWGPYSIYIFGTADLAEETSLRAQLYKDNQAVDWWPANYGVRVRDSKWEFSVKAGENKAPEELPSLEKDYSLWIWRTHNPAVMVPLPLVTPDRLIETYEPGGGGETAELEGSRWQLVSLNDTELLTDTIITLKFQDGKATGSSGCNFYGGRYETKAPNRLNVYELTTTALDCGERINKQADAYLKSLRNAICCRVVDDSLELYDVITNNRSLVFERQPKYPMNPADLVSTKWELVSLNGDFVPEGITITLDFESDTLASGQAGCFAYSLPYEADGDNIRWGINSRRTGELSPELEKYALRYTDSLLWAFSYRLAKDRLEIFTSRGDTLIYKAH
jgi:heat shock protein HslJ